MSSPAVGQHVKTRLSEVRSNDSETTVSSFKHITVQVGPEDKCRELDIDIRPLTNHSEFFAIMLSSPRQDSQSNTLTLAGALTTTPISSLCLRSSSTMARSLAPAPTTSTFIPSGSRRDRTSVRLTRAWVLGDKLQATAFKDAVADAICDNLVLDQKWPITLHQIIYAESPSMARRIRRLCVDIAVTKWDARTLQGTLEDDA